MSLLAGQVEIRVLDKDTLEVVDVITQNNVITRKGYISFVGGTTPSGNIYISTSTNPSYEDWGSVASCITDGFLPAGVTSPLDVAVQGTPRYVQFMRRFNAPGSTRSISSIALPYTTSDTFSNPYVFAYVCLSVPCVQTNTQILDVYYRVQANDTTSYMYNNSPTSAVRTLFSMMGLFGYTTGYVLPVSTNTLPIYSNVPAISNVSPTNRGKMCPTFALEKSVNRGNSVSTSNDLVYGNKNIYWSYNTSSGVGDIHGAMAVMPATWPNEAFTVTNLNAPNGSKIQPIFSHAASTKSLTTANPFLDSSPSAGTGAVNFSGTWSAGNMPELYKVDIVAGGAVGVATYTFSKRNHFGFRGATYCSDANSLPGLYHVSNTAGKAHTCVSLAENTTVGGYGNRVEKYDETRLIMYDATGVTRYDCANNGCEQWDATSSPALPATNIRQVAVNPGDGSIWIACANTGIYKIDSTGTTVTNFTTANGLFSNSVYALDIGRNNAVWAVCQGAMVTSPDNGATWTYYNSTTTPSFTCQAIDNEWNSVNYMRVDPTHADDRVCIVRKENAVSLTTTSYLWWSRGTGVVVYGLTSGFGTYNQLHYRRFPSMFNVSDNNGIWVILGAESGGGSGFDTIYKLTYGTTSVATTTLPTNTYNMVRSVMFVRDSANTQDLIMVMGDGVEGYQSGNALNSNSQGHGMHHIYLYNSSLALVTHAAPPALTTNSNAAINRYSSVVYLGNGVIAGVGNIANWPSYWFEIGSAGLIFAISGDGTPSGGPLEYLTWQKYGWDGSQWVQGNTNAKITHFDAQPMLHGINISFTDGGSGSSFITNDFYTGSVNDGVLKNNAMTLSGSYTYYTLPTQQLTDFDGVVRVYPWTTGPVTWRKVASSLTINGDNSITNNLPYRSYGMSAGSKNRVFGDFSITGSFVASGTQVYQIGIRAYNNSDYPGIREDSYNNWSFYIINSTVYIYNSANSSVWNSAFSGTISWNITRVGNTLTFYTSGVARYTTTDTTYSFIVNARFNNTGVGTNPATIRPITIDSSGVGYYVGLGNSATGTGIYNNKQLVTYFLSAKDVQLNGTVATAMITMGTPVPAPGGVAVAPEEGMLFFNAADVGKTVTGSYLMSYQASTPCNIIPT